jgi:metal-responsive CopG/Arc/MetJ family transcriptional regulator
MEKMIRQLVLFPSDLAERIEAVAGIQGLSKSALVRLAVCEYLLEADNSETISRKKVRRE